MPAPPRLVAAFSSKAAAKLAGGRSPQIEIGRRSVRLTSTTPASSLPGMFLRKKNKFKKRLPLRRVSVQRAPDPKAPATQPPDLVISVLLPGAIMCRRPYPAGVPDTHSRRSAHLHFAKATAAAFAGIPADERSALFGSLTKTVRRAEYHRLRYVELRQVLDSRRENLPGEVFWDEFVEVLHHEMQAFCGAARTSLDEIVYLVARVHGAQTNRARKKPWETADLMTEPLPAECNVPEIGIARTRLPWFQLLNAYRNSFYHHGWRHGSGHFAADDERQAATDPAANALIVPDQSSLGRRSKPHEWTYKDGTTIDDVMRLASEGLDGLLKDLCEQGWSTCEPEPGTVPRADQANMIVSLVVPALVQVHDVVVLPFFTTREKAEAFEFVRGAEAELVDVPVSTAVINRAAVTFSLKGLEQTPVPPGTTQIKVLVDPVATDGEWKNLNCTAAIDVSIPEVLNAPTSPLSIPIINDVKRLFTWQRRNPRGWVP